MVGSNCFLLALFFYFLEIKTEFIAVEVNSTIIPKSEFAIHLLSENDKITIINAVGGG